MAGGWSRETANAQLSIPNKPRVQRSSPSPSAEPRTPQGFPHWLLLPPCSCIHRGVVWGHFWGGLFWFMAVQKPWAGRDAPTHPQPPWLCMKQGQSPLCAALWLKSLVFMQPLFINTSKSFPP